MLVKIGPYVDYIGPYQIAEKLLFWIPKYDENYDTTIAYDKYVNRLGEMLASTPLDTICQWINSRQHRKIKVKIHDYDTWSMDSTLALIVPPMLKQLKEIKHGSAFVALEDVPEYLRYTDNPEYETSQLAFDFYNAEDCVKIDCDFHTRWDWVLNEMIYAFEMILDDDNWMESYKTQTPMTEEEKKQQSRLDKLLYKDVKVEYDLDAIREVEKRISNGFRLFGTYYRSLWD